jgi:hypothetical protein
MNNLKGNQDLEFAQHLAPEFRHTEEQTLHLHNKLILTKNKKSKL